MQAKLDQFFKVTNEIIDVVRHCPQCSNKVHDLDEVVDLAHALQESSSSSELPTDKTKEHQEALKRIEALEKELKRFKGSKETRKPKKQPRSGIYAVLEDAEGNELGAYHVWNILDEDTEKFRANLTWYKKPRLVITKPDGEEKNFRRVPDNAVTCRFEPREKTQTEESLGDLSTWIPKS